YQALAPGYENVHRGQSSASQAMTAMLEESYDTIARFIGAPGRASIGVESRAGCHCATLAHHALGLNPPASCRLSFYLYNTPGEIDRAVDAVAEIAAGRGSSGGSTSGRRVSGSRFRSWPAGRHRTQPSPSGAEQPAPVPVASP